jgi:hypothetical protein
MWHFVNHPELRQTLAAAKLTPVSITLKHVTAFNRWIAWNAMPSASFAWRFSSNPLPVATAFPFACIAPLNVTGVGMQF